MDFNIIQQNRYHTEFHLLPRLFFEERTRPQMLDDLCEHGGRLLEFLYRRQARPEPPAYTAGNFAVHAPVQLGRNLCLLIEMPLCDLCIPLCRRVYLLWGEYPQTPRYFTVEMSFGADILGQVTPDGSHLNHGAVTAEHESELIAKLSVR